MALLLDEKSSLYIDNHSALEERSEKEIGDDEEDYEDDFGNDGYCGWLGFLCLGRQRYYKGERVSLLQQAQGENRESLWRRKLKEAKEITELLCGPKWKNLIRKISFYANNMKSSKRRRVQFHYDPHSYALNFDHGEDDDGSRLDFISRFAPLYKINGG